MVKVFITGHKGLVGSAFVRYLSRFPEQYSIITADRTVLDLRNREATLQFVTRHKPDWILNAAAKVGGITANKNFPVQFLVENLAIQMNIAEAAYQSNAEKLLLLGSNCIYPKNAPQPVAEASLLTGGFEPTNQAYAVAKLCGIELCRSYREQYDKNFYLIIPTSLYGPNDNFSPEAGHVIPGLIRRFHDAKESEIKRIDIWGTGKPLREYMYVDDFVPRTIQLIEKYHSRDLGNILNIGTGEEISISSLAELIREVVDVDIEINYDSSKPDGMMRKLLDSSIYLGLFQGRASTPLKLGLKLTYERFLKGECRF